MKRAAVFAGQGAQSVGMAKDLAEAYPKCRELFERANETLGYDLAKICFEGPEEELTRSNHCQPGIFVASVACYTAFSELAPQVSFTAALGLSLGEWTALHIAGALSFEDTIRLLEARGRFMQEACEARDGAMVSVIGLSLEDLRRICDEADVAISNLNSPAQTVLSGERPNVERADQLATESGAKRTVILKTAGAYHSALMKPAAEQLRGVLADAPLSAPSIPVMSNVGGKPHGTPEDIRQTMVEQVTSSVRWQDDVEWLKDDGVTGYIEFGPGRVLSGLIKRIDGDASLCNVQDCPSLAKSVEGLEC